MVHERFPKFQLEDKLKVNEGSNGKNLLLTYNQKRKKGQRPVQSEPVHSSAQTDNQEVVGYKNRNIKELWSDAGGYQRSGVIRESWRASRTTFLGHQSIWLISFFLVLVFTLFCTFGGHIFKDPLESFQSPMVKGRRGMKVHSILCDGKVSPSHVCKSKMLFLLHGCGDDIDTTFE